jgi:hypothetical protein
MVADDRRGFLAGRQGLTTDVCGGLAPPLRATRTVPSHEEAAMTPSTSSQPDLIELEIGAFMGPHIKRARIALVLIGALYAVLAFIDYHDIDKWHQAMKGVSDGDPHMAALKHSVDVAYTLVVFTGLAGIANIVLAVLGGKMTTFSIYTAAGIFIAHTLLNLYAFGVIVFLGWDFWLVGIVLGMGLQAAYKADQLRKSRIPPEARLLQ